MKTAIVVSGVMRNMINASGSWPTDADYFLFVDKNIYAPQSRDAVDTAARNLQQNIEQCHVKFTHVSVCDNHCQTDERVWLIDHPVANMAWKWKLAYNTLLPFHQYRHYDGVMIIRPDLWLNFVKPQDHLGELNISDGVLASTSEIYMAPNRFDVPVACATDVGLWCSMDTFERLSKFYDFYMKHIDGFTKLSYDFHNCFACFLQYDKITVTSDLSKFIEFVILREDSVNHLFENGRINDGVNINDLYNTQKIWWEKKFS